MDIHGQPPAQTVDSHTEEMPERGRRWHADRAGWIGTESLLIWTVLFGGVWIAILLLPQRTYAGSDDATIAAILHGTISGEPNPHATFVSYVFGTAVSTLASIWPGVGWYAVAVWSILAAGVASAVVFVRFLTANVLLQSAALVTVAVATAPLLLRVSFTTTSILVGGISLIGIAVASRLDQPMANTLAVVSIALATMSIALRTEGFLAAGFALLPLTVAALFSNWRLVSASLAIVLLVGVAILGTNRVGYAGSEWEEYMDWTEARAHLTDYRLEGIEAGRDASGWNYNDSLMFVYYSFYDPDIHGQGPTRAFADATAKTTRPLDWKDLGQRSLYWLAVSVLLGVGVATSMRRNSVAWPLLALLTLVWASSVAIGVSAFRFKPRVWDGILAIAVLGSIAVLAQGRIRWRRSRSDIGAALLIIVLFPLAVHHVVLRVPTITRGPSGVAGPADIAALMTLESGVVLLGEAGAVPNQWDPLASRDSWSTLKYQLPGWHAFSPVWFERSRQLGVLNAPEVLVDNDNILFLTIRDGSERLMQTFLSEHYGIEASACRVEIPGYRHRAWRFVSDPSACP